MPVEVIHFYKDNSLISIIYLNTLIFIRRKKDRKITEKEKFFRSVRAILLIFVSQHTHFIKVRERRGKCASDSNQRRQTLNFEL